MGVTSQWLYGCWGQMGWFENFMLISWDFHKQLSLVFMQNGVGKKKKQQLFYSRTGDDEGQRGMVSVVRADWMSTVQ